MDVVLDTNAYRSLTFGKPIEKIRSDFAAITGSEESKGFRVFMGPVPYIELFGHLVDPNDPGLDACLKAVAGCYLHSRRDPRFPEGMLMPYWQLLAAQALFGHRDPEGEKALYGLDSMAGAISNEPSMETLQKNGEYLVQVKAFADKHKGLFKDSFREKQSEFHSFLKEEKSRLRSSLDTNQIDLLVVCLHFILVSAADVAGANQSDLAADQWREYIVKILKLFPAPAYLHVYIMERLMNAPDLNIEKSKWANLYWDYQLLFYISSQHALILVTGDNAMIDAAEAAGVGDRIFSLERYLDLLKLNITIR